MDASHRRILLPPKHHEILIPQVEESEKELITPQDHMKSKSKTQTLPKASKSDIAPYLTRDLSKSLLLALFILSLQLGLFLAEKAGYIAVTSLFTF